VIVLATHVNTQLSLAIPPNDLNDLSNAVSIQELIVNKNTLSWICLSVKVFLLVMVTRSSLAIARDHYILRAVSFSHLYFSLSQPTDILKVSHWTWLSHRLNLCYTDFFKVPLKQIGAKKYLCQVTSDKPTLLEHKDSISEIKIVL